MPESRNPQPLSESFVFEAVIQSFSDSRAVVCDLARGAHLGMQGIHHWRSFFLPDVYYLPVVVSPSASGYTAAPCSANKSSNC